MQSIKYPELKTQEIEHKKIISSMNLFIKKLPKMKILDIEKELAHFVQIWFISHIVYEDKKITQWINQNDIPEFSFCWINSYKIGNTTIDAEHQELFEIASEAFKEVHNDERKGKIKETLNKLFKYFQNHFENEEEYMISIKYDKTEEHKDIHTDIMNKLTNIIKESPKMNIEDLEDSLSNFIEDSLVNHILEEDKKITYWVEFLEDIKESKELKEL